MLSVTDAQIEVASLVLASRLTRPSTMDINIINPFRITPQTCILEQLTGRFIGCFETRNKGDVCFYLVARHYPDSQIRFLFVYYMNQDHKEIQQWDIDMLKPYLRNIDSEVNPLQIGIINVKCSDDPWTHLSVLIEVIDFTIGYKMINNFQKLRYIDTDTRNLTVGPNKNCSLDHCEGVSGISIENFSDWARNNDIIFKVVGYPREKFSGDATLVRINEHLVSILVDHASNTVNHLLTHRNQYSDLESYAKIVAWINQSLGNTQLRHICTRIIPNTYIRCDDRLVWEAWRLSHAFRPHVFSIIKYNELLYLAGQPVDFWEDYVHRKYIGPREYSFIELKTPADSDDNNIGQSASQMSIMFRSDGRHTCEVCDYDSQSTQVMEQHVWQQEWNVWLDVSKERRSIRDSLIPPVHRIRPHSDFTQTYLKYMICYKEALETACTIWNRYAPTVLNYQPLTILDRSVPLQRGARFIIIALQNPNELHDFLIIADKIQKRWVLISPDNLEHRNKDHFEVSRSTIRMFDELSNYTYEAIPITSSFHREYPRVHLLMSLYVVSRLFRYSLELPKKIIYGESEFRKYASNICAELQIMNAQYNIDNNLVDESGRLLEGAYESLPSPLNYQLSVVPKDQCMYCKKRGFGNLGSHMSMRHGQKAQFANRKRLE